MWVSHSSGFLWKEWTPSGGNLTDFSRRIYLQGRPQKKWRLPRNGSCWCFFYAENVLEKKHANEKNYQVSGDCVEKVDIADIDAQLVRPGKTLKVQGTFWEVLQWQCRKTKIRLPREQSRTHFEKGKKRGRRNKFIGFFRLTISYLYVSPSCSAMRMTSRADFAWVNRRNDCKKEEDDEVNILFAFN